MADNGRWFKLWVTAINDASLDNLSIADFGRWAKFGAYLKSHGTGGTIVLSPPSRSLCAKFQISTFEELIECIKKFPNCTVTLETNTTVTWNNWLKYQGDYSTPRVNKMREVKRTKKRREEKRKEENNTKAKTNGFILPEWVDKGAWEGFVEHRKNLKKPLTLQGKELSIKTLAKLKEEGNDPTKVLNQTVEQGWQGLFAIRADYKKKGDESWRG